MRLKAIILDVDGTLAETEEAHRAAFNRAFAEAGRDWSLSEDDYRALLRVTGGRERIRHSLSTIGETDADDAIAALHTRKNALYGEAAASGAVALRPGIERLIGEAREAGVRSAIATTTSRDNVLALMTHTLGTALACGIATFVTPSIYTAHERFDGAASIRANLVAPTPLRLADLDSLVAIATLERAS